MSEAETDRLRDHIWAKELAIYQARGRGDLGVYVSEILPSYLVWPPHVAKPMDGGALRVQAVRFAGSGAEELAMIFADFTLDGDSAIIYYQTHRTRLPDGSPADEHFEVVHVWLLRDGAWRMFGGMARSTPERA